jgi:hypothetical protein
MGVNKKNVACQSREGNTLGFETFTALLLGVKLFWNAMLCHLVIVLDISKDHSALSS